MTLAVDTASTPPTDVPAAIRATKAQLRDRIGDVAAAFKTAEDLVRAEVADVVARRERGEEVWPVVRYGDIAAGTVSDSDLVRAAVAAIYTEADPDPPTADQFRDRHAGITEVLVNCRTASAVLARRADPADAAAYRQWLQNIAARVCGASRSGGLFGALTSDSEHKFLADLNRALQS